MQRKTKSSWCNDLPQLRIGRLRRRLHASIHSADVRPLTFRTVIAITLLGCLTAVSIAQQAGPQNSSSAAAPNPAVVLSDRFGSRPILNPAQWTKLDGAVDRALVYLAQNQGSDGSFPTHISGQPAVTSLCVMAFLSRGHMPNEGPYGELLVRAIDYVLNTQDYDGTIMLQRVSQVSSAHFEGNYNHSISGLMLGEVYGMTRSNQHERIRRAIEKALELTREQQQRPKRRREEFGGWRYMNRWSRGVTDSDMSVTAWELMFLRSARNAEFDVPQQWIDEAMRYVHNSYDPVTKGFLYGLAGEDRYISRGTAGAGVVSLALAGEHNTPMARETGEFILRHGFERYNRGGTHGEDRYHYSAFYCSQAMFQLGGDYWFRFFPDLLDVLTENQRSDGSWEAESNGNDRKYGQLYSTALTVLTLTPPYQLLPIYQR